MWKELKRGLRRNTFQNYCYMYNQFVRDTIGNCYIATIKKSDIKRFFNYLADERRLKEGTLDSVHVILHQVFQIAVDDGIDAVDLCPVADDFCPALEQGESIRMDALA